MSEIKVNKISPRSGTTVQLGDSGDTVNLLLFHSLSGHRWHNIILIKLS